MYGNYDYKKNMGIVNVLIDLITCNYRSCGSNRCLQWVIISAVCQVRLKLLGNKEEKKYINIQVWSNVFFRGLLSFFFFLANTISPTKYTLSIFFSAYLHRNAFVLFCLLFGFSVFFLLFSSLESLSLLPLNPLSR